MMKAAVVNSFNGHFDIEDVELATPIAAEVKVRVKAAGLCHSDLHLAAHDFGTPLPAVLGHEVAGIVEAVGPEVRDFAIGDHVVGSLIHWCGHCPDCFAGQSYLCAHGHELARRADQPSRITRGGAPVTQGFGLGAFAEFALIHQNQLVKVPDDLPFPQACVLGCACVTGAGAVLNSANVQHDSMVAVVGVGGVGLNVLNGARLAGAKQIFAIDIHPEKEELARKFGATHFVNAGSCDPVEEIRRLTDGGVNCSFEAIGLSSTIRQAVLMTRKGGAAYLIGINDPKDKLELAVVGELVSAQRTITGVYMGSSNIRKDIPFYAELYQQGRFNLDDLVSSQISLSVNGGAKVGHSAA
jgi:S-(hydroxymethyl)glutathione dehydrogenase/alcohol dehydrogenase